MGSTLNQSSLEDLSEKWVDQQTIWMHEHDLGQNWMESQNQDWEQYQGHGWNNTEAQLWYQNQTQGQGQQEGQFYSQAQNQNQTWAHPYSEHQHEQHHQFHYQNRMSSQQQNSMEAQNTVPDASQLSGSNDGQLQIQNYAQQQHHQQPMQPALGPNQSQSQYFMDNFGRNQHQSQEQPFIPSQTTTSQLWLPLQYPNQGPNINEKQNKMQNEIFYKNSQQLDQQHQWSPQQNNAQQPYQNLGQQHSQLVNHNQPQQQPVQTLANPVQSQNRLHFSSPCQQPNKILAPTPGQPLSRVLFKNKNQQQDPHLIHNQNQAQLQSQVTLVESKSIPQFMPQNPGPNQQPFLNQNAQQIPRLTQNQVSSQGQIPLWNHLPLQLNTRMQDQTQPIQNLNTNQQTIQNLTSNPVPQHTQSILPVQLERLAQVLAQKAVHLRTKTWCQNQEPKHCSNDEGKHVDPKLNDYSKRGQKRHLDDDGTHNSFEDTKLDTSATQIQEKDQGKTVSVLQMQKLTKFMLINANEKDQGHQLAKSFVENDAKDIVRNRIQNSVRLLNNVVKNELDRDSKPFQIVPLGHIWEDDLNIDQLKELKGDLDWSLYLDGVIDQDWDRFLYGTNCNEKPNIHQQIGTPKRKHIPANSKRRLSLQFVKETFNHQRNNVKSHSSCLCFDKRPNSAAGDCLERNSDLTLVSAFRKDKNIYKANARDILLAKLKDKIATKASTISNKTGITCTKEKFKVTSNSSSSLSAKSTSLPPFSQNSFSLSDWMPQEFLGQWPPPLLKKLNERVMTGLDQSSLLEILGPLIVSCQSPASRPKSPMTSESSLAKVSLQLDSTFQKNSLPFMSPTLHGSNVNFDAKDRPRIVAKVKPVALTRPVPRLLSNQQLENHSCKAELEKSLKNKAPESGEIPGIINN